MKSLLLMAILACVSTFSATVSAVETRYVTDQMWLQLRSGPSSGHRIIQTLKSGSHLTIHEEDTEKGYARVSTSKGKEGWVLTRYLSKQPIARERLILAEQKLTKLTAELAQTQSRLTESESSLAKLRKSTTSLEETYASTSKELEQIKSLSASAIELNTKSKKLTMRNQELEIQLEALSAENAELASDQNRTFLIYGGALVFLGVFAGLILPSLMTRRSHSSNGWSN